MKDLTIKKIIVFLAIVLLVISVSSACFASDFLFSADDIQAVGGQAANNIQDISGILLGVAQVIGVAVAVIMLIILAIKYLSAAPGEKADIKKSAVVYVVGALLLFGGVAFLNIIQKGASELNDATGSVSDYITVSQDVING